MTSSHDVYATQPAFPFLASSLLASYDMRKAPITNNNQTTTIAAAGSSSTTPDRSSWDLKPSFNEVSGLSTYRNDPRYLFRCGCTIGFSYLKEWNNSVDIDMSRDLLGQVPKRVLASYLLGLRNEQVAAKTGPRVFIIRPSHSATFAPDALLEAVLEAAAASPQTASLSRDQAIDLLDHVELLTIHDFAAATRAISQVSDMLYAMQQQKPTFSTREHKNQNKNGNEEENDDNDDDNAPRQLPTVLLIIEGLDALAENVIRSSDALRGSAMLTPALRSLTYLSRSYARFLAVVLVNTTGLGSPPSSSQVQAVSGTGSQSHADSGDGDRGMRNNNNSTKSAGGLYSVFSRMHEQNDHDTTDVVDTGEPVPLLHTLLSRTMDQAIDIHLLFQRRKGQSLIEVVKDRTGNGLGKWCVWS